MNLWDPNEKSETQMLCRGLGRSLGKRPWAKPGSTQSDLPGQVIKSQPQLPVSVPTVSLANSLKEAGNLEFLDKPFEVINISI